MTQQHKIGGCLSPDEARDVSEFCKMQDAAVAGDPVAQNSLGLCFTVTKDMAKAALWFQRGADQGNADAEYNLGVLYREGTGVPQDYAKAVYWSQRAADQGNARAAYNLGIAYSKGQGAPRDLVKALAWYQQAANQGLASAAYNLGRHYYEGPGIPRDKEKALYWLEKAAAQGGRVGGMAKDNIEDILQGNHQ